MCPKYGYDVSVREGRANVRDTCAHGLPRQCVSDKDDERPEARHHMAAVRHLGD